MDVSTILKRIELRRIELGMSKTEFYEKSGISSATYSQWNTNTFQPSRRKLMAAASALKMTYEELVGQETTIEQKEIPPTKKVDGMEEELIQIFRLLPDDLKAGILAQIKAVLVQRGLLPSQSE
jgi:transcriptional regulator with XRE-family HTH domain|nr:MAG TPA: transcriptional repressor DicA [Caudoviricetes sp.]